MKRRDFLKYTGATGLATPIMLRNTPLYANNPADLLGSQLLESDDTILIIIQLFGGNDGLNTIIPVEDDEYYNIRPDIAVKKEDAERVSVSDIYLHPALATGPGGGFKGLLDNGRLAIIQNVGYPNPNLSHFRSTDIWLSGFNTSDPTRRLDTGWVGRYFSRKYPGVPLELPEHPLSIQIGGTLSTLLKGETGDMGITLTDPQKFFELGQGLSPDDEPLEETSAYAEEFNYIRTIAKKSDTYSQVVKSAFDAGKNTVNYANGFPQQLKLTAKLISGGLRSRVYLLYMGGFDTHVQQQNTDNTGLHPRLLSELSAGIATFMQDALNQGFANKVIGLTISEFGRRPQQNGSNGTDHGAASIQFVFGERVRGGVYGNVPNLTNLDRNGDLVFEYDYRRVYADILGTWFSAPQQDIADILDGNFAPLGVLRQPVSVPDATIITEQDVAISVFPMPVQTQATVRFTIRKATQGTLALYSTLGGRVNTLAEGNFVPGTYEYSLSVPTAGAYFLSFRSKNGGGKEIPLTVVK